MLFVPQPVKAGLHILFFTLLAMPFTAAQKKGDIVYSTGFNTRSDFKPWKGRKSYMLKAKPDADKNDKLLYIKNGSQHTKTLVRYLLPAEQLRGTHIDISINMGSSQLLGRQ